jgi:hypothetical protein
VILTVLTIYGNRAGAPSACTQVDGDFMTFEQIVTYIIAPLIAAGAAFWALVKIVIPRIIEARLEGEKDTREYSQKKDQLEQLSRLSDAAATHQVVAELLANSQDKEEKANEFVRTVVFNTLDKIKTDSAHIPGLIGEIKELSKRVTGLETRQRLLRNLIIGGIPEDEEEPADDYEAWRKRKLGNEDYRKSVAAPDSGGSDEE